MKTLKYLSPSSISKYVDNRIGFYMWYLADCRPDKEPQTEPMALGSSFDAYCKSYLHKALGFNDPRFELQTIFEKQVEPHRRDVAWKDGAYLFDLYKRSGCLSDIFLELKQCIGEPRFEYEVEGFVESKELTIASIPFLGKPDISYTHKNAFRITTDWKVNAFYSKHGTSPKKGFVRMRDAISGYPPHKECMPGYHKGVKYNMGHTLEMIDVTWARQLAIYSWLFGEPVGSEDFLVGIDQVVCRPSGLTYPNVRFAEHRLKISKAFQLQTFAIAHEIWTNSSDGWFFKEMSKIDSQLKCERLDKAAELLKKPIETDEQWFARLEIRQ